MVRPMFFDAIDPGLNQPFNFFFIPFQISYRIKKAFIFNKNEYNNQKVENKISGRCSWRGYFPNKVASI